MSARRSIAFAWALAVVGAVSGRGAEVDPFYDDAERQGVVALERGRAADAVRLLRTACFGLLDLPERLAPCLARLARAQSRAGDAPGFAHSFERLEQLEERFGTVRTLALAEAERSELAGALRQRIAPALLAGSPIAFLSRDSNEDAPPGIVARTQPPAPTPTAEPRSAAAADGAPAPAAKAPTVGEQERIAAARALLAGSPTEADLATTLDELAPLAAARPDDRELHELVALVAYRASRWPLCAEHFRLGARTDETRPLVRFYMAVCYYETGDRPAAAAALEPALDRLKRTPFVDGYVVKILGGASGAP